MQKLLLYVLVVLTFATVVGQAQTATPPPATPPAPQSAPAPKPTVDPLTELQRSKLDNIALKIGILQMQAQQQYLQQTAPLNAEKAALVAEILKEHPGFAWHEAQGPGDVSGLVPEPKVVVPAKAK